MIVRIECPHCHNIVEDEEKSLNICPYCGKPLTAQRKPVVEDFSSTIDNHVDNRNQSDNSIHNTTNNQTVINNNYMTAAKAEPEMSREEMEEAYRLEREILAKQLRDGTLETFIQAKFQVDSDEKTGRINRVEAARRRKLIEDAKEEFLRQQQREKPYATATSAPAPKPTPVTTPRPAAAPAPQPVRRPSSPAPSSTQAPTPTGGGKQTSPLLKYVVLAVVIGGIIWWWSGNDKPQEDAPVVAEAVSQQETEEPAAPQATAAKPTSASKRNAGTSAPKQEAAKPESTQPAAPRESAQQPAEPAAPSAPAPAQAEAAPQQPAAASPSAAELINAGKKAVRSFNYASALSSFKQAAAQGNTDAYFQLGLLYANTNFDGHSRETSISYFEKAASAGNVEAMYQIGLLYIGVDNSQARTWLKKAADRGHEDATRRLNRL